MSPVFRGSVAVTTVTPGPDPLSTSHVSATGSHLWAWYHDHESEKVSDDVFGKPALDRGPPRLGESVTVRKDVRGPFSSKKYYSKCNFNKKNTKKKMSKQVTKVHLFYPM